jgi:acyl-CoA:acyl-CoA alkyltransferase
MVPNAFLYEKVRIAAFGYELPPNVVLSEELEDRLAPLYHTLRIQKGQLAAMTGVRERRFWNAGYPMSQGAISAGQQIFRQIDIPPAAIGMLVYGGVCRENLEPATACRVAHGLGISSDAVVYDLSNACLGVVNGIIQVANAIELGQIEAGLVVSCESAREIVDSTMERMLETPDMEVFRKTVATLTGGSGAVAVLLTSVDSHLKGHRLLGGVAKNATQYHELCTWGPDTGIPTNRRMVMNTDAVGVLRNGVTLGIDTFSAFKSLFSLPDHQPDKIICHQVGSAHQQTILNALGIDQRKDFTTFEYLGNIGTVSLPITLAIAEERGFLEPDDFVGLFGIGSGLNCMMLGVQW